MNRKMAFLGALLILGSGAVSGFSNDFDTDFFDEDSSEDDSPEDDSFFDDPLRADLSCSKG